MKVSSAALLSRLLSAAALFLIAPGCRADPPLDVAPVELSRFQGKWYEIAKLPRPTQAGCENTTAFYRLRSSSELDVTNECTHDGSLRSVSARAVVSDPDVPAKLSLDVGGFFGDYWIIEVGSQYEYAVVGHPTREYLWILSRTPTLAQNALNGIVERAQERQFDVSRLEYTVQR
jgi:apolipoprotein D and lipocalin family protein